MSIDRWCASVCLSIYVHVYLFYIMLLVIVWSLSWLHGLQHNRSPCPTLSPRVCSNSVESVISDHLILCHPFLHLLSMFRSIRVFSNELALCITWPKYWSFNFNISPFNEYSGLISFRIDWFDLLVVQGILKSLLQHPIKNHQFFGT